jgi:hypothetical protein
MIMYGVLERSGDEAEVLAGRNEENHGTSQSL